MLRDVKQLLNTAAYYPQEIERVLDSRRPSFLKFDPELGYVQIDHLFRDGIYNTLSAYTYEKHGGHRKLIHYADQPCRINTYGDSFTQCAQVSDGETWQEVLAAHFREPIRNFGIGGYGVYHAYLRAMRAEVTDVAAEYIILNIWDDDHLRNIDAARWMRVAWVHKDLPRGGGEGTYPAHGFPWAHVRYDLKQDGFVELPGFCKNDDDLRKLADRDYYCKAFKDDQIVHLFTLGEGGKAPTKELEKLAEVFGLKVNLRDPKTRMQHARKLHIAYGLRSTEFILDKMTAWAKRNNRKLMVLLSYNTPPVKQFIAKRTRFDQAIVEYLQSRNVLCVDTLKKAADEYKVYKLPVDEFLDRLYIPRAGAQVFGHYSPHGNFWFAYAIRREVVDWLNPKPLSYR